MAYIRLAIVACGVADGLLFQHVTGSITALITIGVFDIAKLWDTRSKRKRETEAELWKLKLEAQREARIKRNLYGE